MIFTRLKDRLNPPSEKTTFVRDKTTPEFKNQVLGIIHKHYSDSNWYDLDFDISDYSDEIMTDWSIANCMEPLDSGRNFSRDALYMALKKCDGYYFFELLDCMLRTLYSDYNVRYSPVFKDFIEDLNESLMIHGIDYTITDGMLVPRTERTLTDNAIEPCLECLKRYELFDADSYMRESFEKYKSGNYNEAMECATKALENVVQRIIEVNKIQCKSETRLHEKISILMKESPFEFLSDKFEDQYLQMDKIFQVAVSSRNKGSHGSHPFVAKKSLVEHTINIVCSDILFLIRIFYEEEKGV